MSIVATEDRGPVRHVILNRPEKRNAMNDELLAALGAALHDAAHDPAVRIVVVRSITTRRSIAAGIEAWSTGSRALTRSTVPMMLAPGWRRRISKIAGLPSLSARLRRFSTESCTEATSPSRTAAPLW